jgi:hypothetical protein
MTFDHSRPISANVAWTSTLLNRLAGAQPSPSLVVPHVGRMTSDLDDMSMCSCTYCRLVQTISAGPGGPNTPPPSAPAASVQTGLRCLVLALSHLVSVQPPNVLCWKPCSTSRGQLNPGQTSQLYSLCAMAKTERFWLICWKL